MALALIVYPDTGYNSFATLLEANDIVETTVHNTTWTALTDTKKMQLLITAFRNIISLPGFELPDASDDCLKDSQALMAVHDSVNSISESSGTPGQIKIAKVGSVEVEYADGSPSSDISVYPDYVLPCLESYGATASGSVFRFDRA